MPHRLNFGSLSLEGASTAGEQTWFRIQPPGLAFDVGRGAVQLAGARDLFITHGHLDHALGVPWVLSLRKLQGQGATRVFCPQEIEKQLADLIRSAERLEGIDYEFSLRGLEPGCRVEVAKNLVVESFRTDHPLVSLGYHLYRRQRGLRSDFQSRSVADIVAARQRGEIVEEHEEILWLSYAGDTGARVFDLDPRICEAEILLLECTFLDERTRDRGKSYGHLHLEDLVERRSQLRNRDLVLHHVSRRYPVTQIATRIADRLAGIVPRIHVLCGDCVLALSEPERQQ